MVSSAASPVGASGSANLGRAVSMGRLSVPPSWAGAAPAMRLAARALPDAAPAGFSGAEGEGLGAGPGMLGPAGLTAAAAGGGGAAGSGWASQRAGASRDGRSAQPEGGAVARYGYRPTVLPPVARSAPPHDGAPPQGVLAGPQPSDAEGPLGHSVREELNSLRKQIADLAMERDVLMRSAAMWAQQAAERTDG